MRFDWVIVGAGLVGCTLAERIANKLNQRVLVIEARGHIGGNTFDELDEHGILVHRYGPHAFHTNDERVWQYLSRFTDWRPYEHRVLAEVDGRLIPVPFNLNSLDALFPPDLSDQLQELLFSTYGPGREIPILRLREARDPAIRKLADFVYEKIFSGYTVKQWALTPEQLGPTVTGRVPVRLSRDNRYFRDRHQAVPVQGYKVMVQRMLLHKNIEVALNTPFEAVRNTVKNSRLIYTGPMDSFFGYMHGPLPYRSLRFEFEFLAAEHYQATAQINYPNAHKFTRIIEHKHITGQFAPGTTITREYPGSYEMGCNEPYYPIPQPENQTIAAKYSSEIAKLKGTVLFAGRLADYKYYNMDQAVARALSVFEREIAPTTAYAVGA